MFQRDGAGRCALCGLWDLAPSLRIEARLGHVAWPSLASNAPADGGSSTEGV